MSSNSLLPSSRGSSSELAVEVGLTFDAGWDLVGGAGLALGVITE